MDFQLRPDRDLTVLIPARAGSIRLPGKNMRLLRGRPLIQWTIDAVHAAMVARVVVSSDDPETLAFAETLGCDRHVRRDAHATAIAPDIEWVRDVLPLVTTPYVAICRPTSPFRTASTIRRGYAELVGSGADSIRAVSPVTAPHPAKMWVIHAATGLMTPVLVGQHPDGTPWHSSPTQVLPPVWVQNASLEVAQVSRMRETDTISGMRVRPLFTDALEGFDINTPEDWREAERLAARLC